MVEIEKRKTIHDKLFKYNEMAQKCRTNT